jgi:hypothetical protein
VSGRASRLAAYLDQRRRMGEPGIVPAGLEPGELITLLSSPAEGPAGTPAASSRAVQADRRRVPTGTADYEALRETAMGCTRCRLSGGRKTVVFSDGNPTARLMVIVKRRGLTRTTPASRSSDRPASFWISCWRPSTFPERTRCTSATCSSAARRGTGIPCLTRSNPAPRSSSDRSNWSRPKSSWPWVRSPPNG